MYKPNFTITPAILNDISYVTEIKTIVERSKVLPLNEAHLKRQAIVRMAHTSTSIEGNPLAQYQVEQVLSGKTIRADDKSIFEVKNYQDVLFKVEELSKSDAKISLNLILDLHKILMKGLLPEDKVGHFRSGPIYIVDDLGNGQEKVRYSGPDPKKVPFLLNELILWYYSKEAEAFHPVLKAAVFHLQFVLIHPFSDGNGRMTRLLATLILYSHGWDFRKVLVLDDFYNRNRQNYYDALSSAHDGKYADNTNITDWIEYFTGGFLYEAEQVKDQIQFIGMGEDQEQVFLDKDEMKIIDFLAINGKVTSTEAEDLLGIPKRTAQFKLKALVDKKLIALEGKGPSAYYIVAK